MSDPEGMRERSGKDFRKTRPETAELNPEKSEKSLSDGNSKSHPVQDLVQKVREAFLELGFDEIENQIFVPEEDVYRQYGSEAPVILDRVYYLAGLPRPDIGLSDEKLQTIREFQRHMLEKRQDSRGSTSAPPHFLEINLLREIMQGFFRDYREGKIEGDDFLEEAMNRLEVDSQTATKIIDLFPEFKNIQPIPSKTTLRSHMTGAWFPTIAALKDTQELPMKLFSVGMRFRREQKLDATHLRAHYGGSMVIVDKKLDLKDGKKITEEILKKLDFGDIKFVKKKATSNYYAPGTEYEVFSGDIEVADIGLYNPESLKKYGIGYDVFNLGFGLERILMVKEGISDVRELLYPQFYKVVDLTDGEIAGQISIENVPQTEDGRKLAEEIKKSAEENAEKDSPLEVVAYKGALSGKEVEVKIVEKEENKKLLGPAALNRIYVHDGNVYGLPEDVSKLNKELAVVKEKGVSLGFDFLDAVSNYFAAEIEKATEREGMLQVKMAKGPGDVNIVVGDIARRFITSKNGQISMKGPVFMSVEFRVL